MPQSRRCPQTILRARNTWQTPHLEAKVEATWSQCIRGGIQTICEDRLGIVAGHSYSCNNWLGNFYLNSYTSPRYIYFHFFPRAGLLLGWKLPQILCFKRNHWDALLVPDQINFSSQVAPVHSSAPVSCSPFIGWRTINRSCSVHRNLNYLVQLSSDGTANERLWAPFPVTSTAGNRNRLLDQNLLSVNSAKFSFSR